MVKRLYKKIRRNNKKGLSDIVTTVILVALSMAAVVIVWVFINNLIKGQIKSTESCFGNFDKVKLNGQYTCYDIQNNIFRISLTVGNVQVDKVIISVSSASAVKSYEITNTAQAIDGLVLYSGGDVILPGKNSGLTYNATGFPSNIDLIQIAPVISGTQCEISDTISEIEFCQ
ncbi:hypothetical protein M0R19_02650 [Candidatus Pacearchaeota archaeon]|jgi:hypothetical protein|nr:hypothetical protein [Candidatus Pacearchaeota archaeon]